MSQQRLRRSNSGRIDLLKSKLSAVDNHIRRQQKLPSTLFMNPDMIEHIGKPIQKIQQITNQLQYNVKRSILFGKISNLTLFFYYRPLQSEKRYCLKLEPNKVQVSITLFLDGNQIQKYNISKSQAILIKQTNWKKAEFVIKATAKQRLSLLKLQIVKITVEYKTKVNGFPPQKKIVQAHLKQFIRENISEERIQQILQRRRKKSQSQIKQRFCSSRKTLDVMQFQQVTDSFKSSTLQSPIKNRKGGLVDFRTHSAQVKRDFSVFQESKNKFLKHLQKMKPETFYKIMSLQNSYIQSKNRTLMQTSKFIVCANFAKKLYEISTIISKHKMMRIRVHMMCRKFIKNISSGLRNRHSLVLKTKLAFDLTISSQVCILFSKAVKQSQKLIIDSIKMQMFKIDVPKIADLCLRFKQKCIVIQNYFRKILRRYRQIFIFLACIIKKHIFKNDQHINICLKQYKKHCYKKSRRLRYGFIRQRNYIDIIFKKQQEKAFQAMLTQQQKSKQNNQQDYTFI